MGGETARLIGQMMGAALLPLLVGWWAAHHTKRKHNVARLPKSPIIIGAALAILIAGNSFLQAKRASSRVQVARFEQPAPDSTEADLTYEYLQQNAARMVADLEKESADFPTTASTELIEKDGRKLGVIRLKTKGAVPAVTVFGFAGGKFISIVCSGSEFTNVDVQAPECAQALQSDFGTTLNR